MNYDRAASSRSRPRFNTPMSHRPELAKRGSRAQSNEASLRSQLGLDESSSDDEPFAPALSSPVSSSRPRSASGGSFEASLSRPSNPQVDAVVEEPNVIDYAHMESLNHELALEKAKVAELQTILNQRDAAIAQAQINMDKAAQTAKSQMRFFQKSHEQQVLKLDDEIADLKMSLTDALSLARSAEGEHPEDEISNVERMQYRDLLNDMKARNEELERELAEFRTNKLDASTEEILGDGFVTSVVHQNVVKALRKELSDTKEDCKQQLSDKKESSSLEIQELRIQLAESQTKLREAESMHLVDEMPTETPSDMAKLSELQNKITESVAQKSVLECRIGELEAQLKNQTPVVVEAPPAQGTQNSEEMKLLKERLEGTEKSAQRLTTDLLTVTALHSTAEENLKQSREENGKLKTALEDLKKSLEAADSSEELSSLQKKIEALEKAKAASDKARQKSLMELQQAKQLSKQSSEESSAASTQLTDLQTRHNTLEAEHTSLKEEFSSFQGEKQTEIEALSSQLAEVTQKLQSLKETHSKLKETHSAASERLSLLEGSEEQQAEQRRKALEDQRTALLKDFTKLKENFTVKLKSVTIALKKKEKMAGKLQKEFKTLKTQYNGLKTITNKDLKDAHTWAIESVGSLSSQVSAAEKRLSDAAERYQKEVQARKLLYNKLQELKGNIRVYARCRPMNAKEKEKGPGSEQVVQFPSATHLRLVNSENQAEKLFEFDKVYDPTTTQSDVFNDTLPLVQSVIDGYNVCIFAYGQTGTGKTYTMEGPSSDPGVNTRALTELFKLTEQRQHEADITVTVSIIEIYNEMVRDLLSKNKDPKMKGLEIKMQGSRMEVPDALEKTVKSMVDVRKCLDVGKANRASASTNMNEHSSRSHLLLRVRVRSVSKISGLATTGKLTLIDLAGSERVAKTDSKAERLKEAQAINKSLSALGDVIFSLSSKTSHVPFRNSKLTYLLQDSLGGDSKVLMFVQVSPAMFNYQETHCSLLFAARARSVEIGGAKANVENPQITALQKQVESLKEQLASK